jgi:hypothetical protein
VDEAGEALGVGGRDARWRGGAGRTRQGRRWERQREEEEAGALTGGGAVRGIAGSGAHRQGRCGANEVGA